MWDVQGINSKQHKIAYKFGKSNMKLLTTKRRKVDRDVELYLIYGEVKEDVLARVGVPVKLH